MKKKIEMQKPESEQVTAEELFELFLRKCRVKNLSEQTIKTYQEKMLYFWDFFGKETVINDINEDVVDEYVLYLREKSNANDISINSYLRHLRAVLYYGIKSGYVHHSFTVKLIKAEKKIKETYTESELERLLKKPETNSFREYEIWVLENYLLATGNRISTALDLQIGDLDFDNMVITLRRTKNRRQQLKKIYI